MKPSAWAGAVGLGLFGMSVVGVIVALAERAVSVWFYAAWFFGLFGLVLAVDLGMSLIVDWRRAHVDIRLDQARAWANELSNQAKDAELARAELPPVITAPVPAPETWKTPLIRWFRAGDHLGFGVRSLAPNIVSGPDWGKLTAFYCSEAGWGVLQCRGGQAVTEWGEGWTLAAVLAEIERGALPCPPGPPLDVHVLLVDTTQTEQKHAKKGKRGAGALTVDSTAREVGQ